MSLSGSGRITLEVEGGVSVAYVRWREGEGEGEGVRYSVPESSSEVYIPDGVVNTNGELLLIINMCY